MDYYNCHVHIFTSKSVPNDFLPLGLTRALQYKPVRFAFCGFLKYLFPFTSNDKFDRYAKIAKMSNKSDQTKIFEKLKDYYPENTKFIILPMDMEFSGYDRKPSLSYEQQHLELIEISKKHPNTIIPFMAINPNRHNIFEIVQNFVENKGFRGFKMYPKLGYDPFDFRLHEIYEYAEKNQLPIISHCSQGGVKHEDVKEKDINNLTQPVKYIPVLQKYPNLKLCLAHFGGSSAWKEYNKNPSVRKSNAGFNDNWLAQILAMLLSGKYPNLYVDLSYTILDLKENIYFIKSFLKNPILKEKILFGSDFYMSEDHKYLEENLFAQCQKLLGKQMFDQIAHTNPKRFLNLNSKVIV